MIYSITCKRCKTVFESAGPAAKYCPECKQLRKQEQNQSYRTQQKKAKRIEIISGLDDKLEDLHAAGKTYAEAQREETIEKYARITIKEPPEVPAESEANMSMDPATRKALIRAQAKLEVLVEFFRAKGSDTIEFPGRVISEVVAALSEAVEEPEDEHID